jgi:hypothetical protein
MNLINIIKKQDFFEYCETMNDLIKNMPKHEQDKMNKLMKKFIENYNGSN